jgi:hypothetical protein
MFKNFMNGVSLSSMMLRDADNEGGTPTAAELRNKQREELIKNNTVNADKVEKETPEEEEEENEENEEEEEKEESEEEEEKPEETEEQKAEREAKEKIEAKAQRKTDRMQRRIDTAIADKKNAEAEIARLKAQLEANPEKKLTEEEVESKAEAIAAKKIADKEMADLQANFDKACDKLAKEAIKIDPKFNDKINDIAEQFGAIPSFMIGVLEDFDNGGEVLAFIANDDEVAEEIYSLKGRPAKMTKELVAISNKLLDAKKPKAKKLSAVPDPVAPVKGSRVVSNEITDADTKDMDKYVAKRQRQMAEYRKQRGGF